MSVVLCLWTSLQTISFINIKLISQLQLLSEVSMHANVISWNMVTRFKVIVLTTILSNPNYGQMIANFNNNNILRSLVLVLNIKIMWNVINKLYLIGQEQCFFILYFIGLSKQMKTYGPSLLTMPSTYGTHYHLVMMLKLHQRNYSLTSRLKTIDTCKDPIL